MIIVCCSHHLDVCPLDHRLNISQVSVMVFSVKSTCTALSQHSQACLLTLDCHVTQKGFGKAVFRCGQRSGGVCFDKIWYVYQYEVCTGKHSHRLPFPGTKPSLCCLQSTYHAEHCLTLLCTNSVMCRSEAELALQHQCTLADRFCRLIRPGLPKLRARADDKRTPGSSSA